MRQGRQLPPHFSVQERAHALNIRKNFAMCFAHGKVLPPHSINPSYALVKCCRAEISLGGGSYALCRCVRYSCIYTGCMSYSECGNAITNKTNSLTLLCACIYMWVISLVSSTYNQLVLSLPYMGSKHQVLACSSLPPAHGMLFLFPTLSS